MQLKHIEYFVETSNYKSFNEAAKNLFISQPSLSAAIATLEKELGFKLFTRTKHGIALSTAGNLILPEARKMLEIQHHWQMLSQKLSLFNEPLKIYAQELLCSTILVDLSLKISTLYPNIELILEPVDDLPVSNCLDGNTILLDFYDITQFETLKGQSTDANWTILPVSSLHTYLFLNAKHPLARQETLTLSDLKELKLVTYDIKDSTGLPYSDLPGQFSEQVKLPSREGMFNYIRSYPQAAGLFSSLCMYYPYVQNGSIVPRNITDYPTPIFLAAIFPSDEDLSSFYETIIDEICQATHLFIKDNRIPE